MKGSYWGIGGMACILTFGGALYGGNDGTKPEVPGQESKAYLKGEGIQRASGEGYAFGQALREAWNAKTAANKNDANLSNAVKAYRKAFDVLKPNLCGAWGRVFGTGPCPCSWSGGVSTGLYWNKPTIPAPLEFWSEKRVFKHKAVPRFIRRPSPVVRIGKYYLSRKMLDFIPAENVPEKIRTDERWDNDFWIRFGGESYINKRQELYGRYVIEFFKAALTVFGEKSKGISLKRCADFLDNHFCKPTAELLERQCARLVKRVGITDAEILNSKIEDKNSKDYRECGEFLSEFEDVLKLYAAYRDFGVEYAVRETYFDGKVPNPNTGEGAFDADAFCGDERYENTRDIYEGYQYRYGELKKAIFALTECANKKFGTRKAYDCKKLTYFGASESSEAKLTRFDKVLKKCEDEYRVTFLPVGYYEFGKKMIERESRRRSFVLSNRWVYIEGEVANSIVKPFSKAYTIEKFSEEFDKGAKIIYLNTAEGFESLRCRSVVLDAVGKKTGTGKEFRVLYCKTVSIEAFNELYDKFLEMSYLRDEKKWPSWYDKDCGCDVTFASHADITKLDGYGASWYLYDPYSDEAMDDLWKEFLKFRSKK